MNREFLEEIKQVLSEEQIWEDERMSRHTTFRVGGKADIFLQPHCEQIAGVIRLCKSYDVPYTVIGNGSNLLVSDAGIRGAVIELGRQASEITVEGTMVTAQAGAMLAKAANQAAAAGLTGMEFAAGIPGTIGGAVFMNAGAYGGEMSQILREVTILTPDGTQQRLSVQELDMGYRHSSIEERQAIVLSAVIELTAGQKDAILTRMEELKQQRVAKQPLEYPSAGSTFKRPEGYFAGKLIMDAGLAGYTVGGAMVSKKHCGFVINKGGATAADIVAFMQHVREEVERQFGVTLEAEVRKLGEFA